MNPVTDEYAESEDEKSEGSKHEIAEIRDKFKKCEEYWSDDRNAALDDLKFRAGEQWPNEIVAQREKDKRPCLTVDKLNQYVRQIVNDGRQNRPSIKVRPVDSGSDIATANVYQGLIRHIEDRSNADAAYDTALDSSATGGFGYFRALTEYAGQDTFDQEIVIKRVRNPFTIMIDPASVEADGSDMRYAFVTEMMDKEEFKETYKGKLPDDFETNDSYSDWYGDQVRIAEYWYVEEEDRTLYLLADGSTIPMSRYDELKDSGVDIESQIVDKRNIPVRKVMHCMVSGCDYLTEPKEWLGKWIPIFPVWGNELDIEGKVCHSGIIRPAKDAQRLYNYSRSAFAERVALTPKAPWVAAEGQVEDYEDEWNTANSVNHSVLRYKPTALNGQPVPPPQRVSASDIPSGFAQDMQISEHDIQGAIGMYSASLGAPSNERSGKAIMARQREGDVGTFHYHDNLNRAIRHCGRVLVDLIPKVYDSGRVVRILGYDGTPDQVEINPNLPTASQKMGVKMMYNLGVGTYDVTISTGPSYNTLRQEAAESMVEMVQANPALMGVIGDLMVKNMDWPGADEIAARLALTLPPEIKAAEDAKKQGNESPEVLQIKAQAEQAIAVKDQQMQELMQQFQEVREELLRLKVGEETKRDEIQINAAKVEIDAYEAETKRMTAVSAAMTPEQVQLIVQQTIMDMMQPAAIDTANGMPQIPENPLEQPENGLGA